MGMVLLTALGVGGATVIGAVLGVVFKKISPLLHFIMKLFKHVEKLKELYSGHPYSHHLLSIVFMY